MLPMRRVFKTKDRRLLCILQLRICAVSTSSDRGRLLRMTGKRMDKCCCEMKGGKLYCKLSKKTYNQWCCDMK